MKILVAKGKASSHLVYTRLVAAAASTIGAGRRFRLWRGAAGGAPTAS